MEKIWLASYPSGVPADIDVDALGNIGDYFSAAALRYADRPAFISGSTGVRLSFAELDEQSQHFAAYLQSVVKLPRGSRVALMMPNLLQYPVCLFGLLRAGYVVVNVNPMYTARELEHQLVDSGAEAIVLVDMFAHTLEKILHNTAIRQVLVTGLADMLPWPKRVLGHFVIRQVKKLIPAYHLPGSVAWRTAMAAGAQATLVPVNVLPGELAFLQYTGGTTGVSKGAMLTHANILANIEQIDLWGAALLTPDEELLSITAIPLYHIFALSSCIGMLGVGATNVLISDPRNIDAFVKVLRRYPFASMPSVNTLFNSLVNHPDFAGLDFSQLRFAVGGGAAVQRAVAERWQQITGKPLVEGYGLTECSPTVTVNPFDLKEYNGSIGLPLPSTEISIRDEQGQEVGLHQPGELCVRGPQVMQGYWNQPQETAGVMTADGFLRTGDIATMNELGYLQLVDRRKDMILVSGFNVFPNEIEQVIMLHPEVLEVAAVSQPDAKTGEAVKIFVVKKSAALTEASLISFCRENLTGYKIPRQIVFMDELPKSNVGKILRRELRERV